MNWFIFIKGCANCEAITKINYHAVALHEIHSHQNRNQHVILEPGLCDFLRIGECKSLERSSGGAGLDFQVVLGSSPLSRSIPEARSVLTIHLDLSGGVFGENRLHRPRDGLLRSCATGGTAVKHAIASSACAHCSHVQVAVIGLVFFSSL